MPLATYRTLVGIGKEAVQGTPVAPVDFIPVTNDPKPSTKLTLLEDKGWRGSATDTFGMVAGQRKADFSIDGNVDPNTIGYFLQSMLPDVVVAGAATPYTHTLSLLNSGLQQPAGYTITDFDGGQSNQFAACRFSDLSIAFTADGLLKFTSKATGWAPTPYVPPLAPAFSPNAPIPSWLGVAQIAGAPTLIIADGTIDMKRTVEAIQTVDGNQDPYKMWTGLLTVSGKLNVIYEDQTELNRYLTNSQPALDFKWSLGANASVQLHMSKVAYTVADVMRSKAYGMVSISYTAQANLTDVGASLGYSPIKATLVNTKAAGIFA